MSIARKFAAAMLVTAAFATPAYADACSDSLAKVEEAVASAQLSEQDMASVQGFIEDARAKQAAGDVDGCTTTLAEAKAALQIE